MLNFKSGLQRIYFIGSIGWIIIFLFLGWNGGLHSKFSNYIPYVYLSTDSNCIDKFGEKVLKKIGNSTYEVLLDYIVKDPPYKGTKIEYVYDLSVLEKKSCVLAFERKFFYRIQEDRVKYIYIAFAPIPLYFILLFIIDGFNQPTRKKKRK